MEEVKVDPGLWGYRIIRVSDGKHIKTCRELYLAELIREHGLLHVQVKSRKISADEKVLLGSYHYRKIATEKLKNAGQYLMADKLKKSLAETRKIFYEGDKKAYSIIFSSQLEVRVEDRHFRLFASLPLWKKNIQSVQQTSLQL